MTAEEALSHDWIKNTHIELANSMMEDQPQRIKAIAAMFALFNFSKTLNLPSEQESS